MATPRPPRDDPRPLIVCAGYTVPHELVRAAGGRVGLVESAPGEPTELGDLYMEAGLDPDVRSVFDQLARGNWNHARLVVIDRCYRDVYYYLKELVRLGLAPDLPPIHIFDLLLSRELPVQQYNRRQVELLADAVEHATRTAISSEDLRRTFVESNAVREQYRRLDRHRRRGAVLGTDALPVIAAGRTGDPCANLRGLEAFNESLETADSIARPRLVLLSGDAGGVPTIHAAAERAGGNIVAEDFTWGSRTAAPDLPAGSDPVGSLAAAAHRDAAGPELVPYAARVDWCLHAVNEQVDGVILHIPTGDRTLGWYVPELRKQLEARGVRVVTVIADVHTPDGASHLEQAVGAWLRGSDGLGGRLASAS
ncbi:2-hydroxyacyl-CoA dehydratase [Pseudonocardia sp. DLS-67]